MSRRATFAALAALAAALPCAALPLGLRLTQAAVTQAASAKEKDPLLMTEEEAYAAYAPDTAFVIDTTLIGTNVYMFGCGSADGATRAVEIDWGDGEKTVSTTRYISNFAHEYAKAGRYVVRLKDGLPWPIRHYGNATTPYKPAVVRALRWGDATTYTQGAFASCSNLLAPLPRWPQGLTDAGSTYKICAKVDCEMLDWPSKVVSVVYCWNSIPLLHGSVKPWPDSVKDANYCFVDCTGLTGDIPAWGANVESVANTYNSCTGLTGDIPAWGAKITNAVGTYKNCTGLTGAWTDDPDLLMPATITSHGNVSWGPVSGASDAVRRLFYSDWGGTKPKPTE